MWHFDPMVVLVALWAVFFTGVGIGARMVERKHQRSLRLRERLARSARNQPQRGNLH